MWGMQWYPWCRWGINVCNGPFGFGFVCELVLMYCQTSTVGRIVAEAGNFNVYDIRLPCDFPLCYDFSRLDDYLAQDSVRAALGVGDRKYGFLAPHPPCCMVVPADECITYMPSHTLSHTYTHTTHAHPGTHIQTHTTHTHSPTQICPHTLSVVHTHAEEQRRREIWSYTHSHRNRQTQALAHIWPGDGVGYGTG